MKQITKLTESFEKCCEHYKHIEDPVGDNFIIQVSQSGEQYEILCYPIEQDRQAKALRVLRKSGFRFVGRQKYDVGNASATVTHMWNESEQVMVKFTKIV